MKFSIPFYSGNKFLNEVDEITIKYDAEKESALIEFLDEHPNQRVVLRIAKENKMKAENYQYLAQIARLRGEGTFAVRFEQMTDLGRQYGLPHFFLYYCDTAEQASVLAEMGVSDIYVTANLCYQLSSLAEHIKCNIRLFPNIAQSSIEQSDPYTKFFIRPEDLEIYEPYIDYIEFYTEDVKRAAVLYEIYAKRKEYVGWLEEIITGFPHKEVRNEYVTPAIAKERLECNKNCANRWSNCRLCKKYFELAQTAYNNNFIIKLTKGE